MKWFSIFQWVWGMSLPVSLTWLCQSTISCMLRAILNKCTFEFILDGKITLLYQDNMFRNFQYYTKHYISKGSKQILNLYHCLIQWYGAILLSDVKNNLHVIEYYNITIFAPPRGRGRGRGPRPRPPPPLKTVVESFYTT